MKMKGINQILRTKKSYKNMSDFLAIHGDKKKSIYHQLRKRKL